MCSYVGQKHAISCTKGASRGTEKGKLPLPSRTPLSPWQWRVEPGVMIVVHLNEQFA
jgi:hypothetical protein